MTKSVHFDYLTNTLFVTKRFLKAAGVLNSTEYRILMAYRADHPDMSIVPNETHTGKKRISIPQMADYIKIIDKDGQYKKQFETVKGLSKIQPSPYKYVKCWFEATFPDYSKMVSFDENGNLRYAPALTEAITDQPVQTDGDKVILSQPELLSAPESKEPVAGVESQEKIAA